MQLLKKKVEIDSFHGDYKQKIKVVNTCSFYCNFHLFVLFVEIFSLEIYGYNINYFFFVIVLAALTIIAHFLDVIPATYIGFCGQ